MKRIIEIADTYPNDLVFFFFNDTATTEIYTLSLHDALPIFAIAAKQQQKPEAQVIRELLVEGLTQHHQHQRTAGEALLRSEEHTSELQSRQYLVCRLLLEKKKKIKR